MRFYTSQHAHYCRFDLHARTMFVCVLDQSGDVRLHRNLPTRRQPSSGHEFSERPRRDHGTTLAASIGRKADR